MGRRFSRSAAGAATAALVAGCAYNDHFDNRVDRVDIASEQARDQMILTNIVRASKAEPLAFLQIGKVTGFNSSSNQMGLPSLILGPDLPKASAAHFLDKPFVFGANPGASGFAANSLTTSGSTTFDVNPSETKDFYRGLLLTDEPETLAFSASRAWRRNCCSISSPKRSSKKKPATSPSMSTIRSTRRSSPTSSTMSRWR